MRINNLGMSLMELLMGISILSIGGLLIMGILTTTNNIFVKQTVSVNQGLSLNQGSLEIANLIKSSAGVVTQYPVSGNAQFTSGSSALVIKLPAVTAGGQVIDSVYDYAVIAPDAVNPRILRKYVYPDGQSARNLENKVLSTSLASLKFTYLDSGSNQVAPIQSARISFTINLADDTGLDPQESSSSSTINLKNINL